MRTRRTWLSDKAKKWPLSLRENVKNSVSAFARIKICVKSVVGAQSRVENLHRRRGKSKKGTGTDRIHAGGNDDYTTISLPSQKRTGGHVKDRNWGRGKAI